MSEIQTGNTLFIFHASEVRDKRGKKVSPSFLIENFVGNGQSSSQFHQHFYVRIFRMNVVLAAFSSYVLALAKNSYKKCARKMLMKLTPERKKTMISERGGKNYRTT
jgi:hypothetical protein